MNVYISGHYSAYRVWKYGEKRVAYSTIFMKGERVHPLPCKVQVLLKFIMMAC